ncbi:hypothetical protein [Mogibacterium timidum]|uniref:hypothetical protein n=1 Tax=Mogibacterium timidum TaxID=35519 RepID=UPI0023532FC3|nr:hypothetical protein [Mogibacterium timidum]
MKKILITGAITCCIIAGLIFLYHSWYIDYNLRKYSVYYANNMEHKEGTHPELAMAMENMGTIYRPNKKIYDTEIRRDIPYIISLQILKVLSYSAV